VPPRGYIAVPCNGSSLLDHLISERPIVSHLRGNRPRDTTSIQTVDELLRYHAQVVEAIADGIETTREFASRQDISVSNASERFRVARELGWIKLIENEISNVQSRRYAVARKDTSRPALTRFREQ
jgi:hypothetical protein